MKLFYSFPRGYSSEITKAREDNEFDAWVDGKFGKFIRETISDDFIMEIGDAGFSVDFVYETDGDVFLKTLGGRIDA
ncbi:hypothetical protein [Pararhizobium qamdonense]|uniref:hypothetical protein n=1 Tax=Pararhizobium qamdonense TaxID=3031126 RepID=UPI0023E1ED1E|nr:hypothetical protein [Pararhizobium qamdonense]